EEIVDQLDAWPNACVLPNWVVSHICLLPGGAYPSYAQGYYERDNCFYQEWDRISRSRKDFLTWIQTNVINRPTGDRQPDISKQLQKVV
ncbi:MAG TPA: hypothetical protein VE641_14830, partial [Chthoniobacterales bacterium]|nr:hypothetical protein [Chthoniobacterales bacterium]